jgi:hypothetical protein
MIIPNPEIEIHDGAPCSHPKNSLSGFGIIANTTAL